MSNLSAYDLDLGTSTILDLNREDYYERKVQH